VPRVLLLLPHTTYRAPDFLAAARRRGVETVVASDVRQTLEAAMGDRAITLDFDDPAGASDLIVALAARQPLDAIVAADDQGLEIQAAAAARLGLAANPPEAVRATRDKSILRRLLAAAGVPAPAFALVGAGESVEEAVERVGLPCVIKPLHLSGSRGVIRADTPADAITAAARTRRIARAAGGPDVEALVVERYVDGGEVAIDGLLDGGELVPLAVFDKPDPLVGPYFEETIYVTPSRAPAADQATWFELVTVACRALGLREGPIHAELRLGAAGPVVLEVAARTIGGHCSRAIHFADGETLEEVVLDHAVGRAVGRAVGAGPGTETDRSRPAAGAAGVMMIPIPGAGRLMAVDGLAEARAVPGITAVEIAIPLGQEIVPLPEGDRYLGFLFARADRPERAEHALRRAHGALRFHIAP